MTHPQSPEQPSAQGSHPQTGSAPLGEPGSGAADGRPYPQPYGHQGQPYPPYGQQGQPYPPQGQPYGQPYPQPSKTLAIISIVAGGLAVLFSLIPLLAWPLAAAAIVCGIIALVKKGGGRGLSIAGIILGGVGTVIALIVFIVAMAFVSSVEKTSGKSLGELQSSLASASAAANAEHTVQYKVTTNGKAKVSYSDAAGTSDEDIAAPWTKDYKDSGFVLASVSVMADGDADTAQVACEILIDGKTVSKKSDAGAYASAYCSGSAR
ncbi:MmpS family transport accessory protein [Sinomonas atrocyanea]|uniref:MmpS family transport accessory protein n=1 Tax=Sinomonas atrocyanea TaxID=37927 RepID=UPI002865B588|nr:MmpS family transport accessory protein [Sinomonas atrocyanea]MDR6622425.1 hypothetical protein [Sinomonas atrocyanea]